MAALTRIPGTSYHFWPDRIAGEGRTAIVYLGFDKETQTPCAIKVSRQPKDAVRLRCESYIYRRLSKTSGVPTVWWSGEFHDRYAIVLPRFHLNLARPPKLTENEYNLLALKMIRCLESIHSKRIVHGDIKPDDFYTDSDQIGNEKQDIYLADFGSAFVVKDEGYQSDSDDETPPAWVGADKHVYASTPAFASIRGHQGYTLSFRDDLESLSYTLLHVFEGYPRWEPKDNTKHDPHVLLSKYLWVESKTVPISVARLWHYSRTLAFNEMPDYNYVTTLFPTQENTSSPLLFHS